MQRLKISKCKFYHGEYRILRVWTLISHKITCQKQRKIFLLIFFFSFLIKKKNLCHDIIIFFIIEQLKGSTVLLDFYCWKRQKIKLGILWVSSPGEATFRCVNYIVTVPYSTYNNNFLKDSFQFFLEQRVLFKKEKIVSWLIFDIVVVFYTWKICIWKLCHFFVFFFNKRITISSLRPSIIYFIKDTYSLRVFFFCVITHLPKKSLQSEYYIRGKVIFHM